MSIPTYSGRDAINHALRHALTADFRVLLLGQDLADPVGGLHGVTRGLSTAYGRHRVINVPASVVAMCGAAIGAALEGLVPVVELPSAPVSGAVLDQLAAVTVFQEQQLSPSGGSPVFRLPVPVRRAGADNSLDRLSRIPGLQILQPDTPADAESLMLAAVRDPAPCVFLEPVRLYDTIGPRADPDSPGPAPAAAEPTSRRPDVTVVTCAVSRAPAMHAAADLAADGLEVDIIRLHGPESADTDAVLRSVTRTRRLVLAPGSAAAQAQCRGLAELVDRDLLGRLAAPVHHVQTADSGEPRPVDIATAVRAVCSYSRSRMPAR